MYEGVWRRERDSVVIYENLRPWECGSVVFYEGLWLRGHESVVIYEGVMVSGARTRRNLKLAAALRARSCCNLGGIVVSGCESGVIYER